MIGRIQAGLLVAALALSGTAISVQAQAQAQPQAESRLEAQALSLSAQARKKPPRRTGGARIACTPAGCHPIPPGCRPTPGMTWDGMPSGFDVVICPGGRRYYDF